MNFTIESKEYRNAFLKELMGGLTTDVNFGMSTIKNLIIGGG